MCVNEAGADVKAGCVNNFVRFGGAFSNLEDPIVFNENITDKGFSAAAVKDGAVFEKYLHIFTPFEYAPAGGGGAIRIAARALHRFHYICSLKINQQFFLACGLKNTR